MFLASAVAHIAYQIRSVSSTILITYALSASEVFIKAFIKQSINGAVNVIVAFFTFATDASRETSEGTVAVTFAFQTVKIDWAAP